MMRESWRRAAIGVVVALALGAALYFGGRWQERRLAAGGYAARAEQIEAARMEAASAQAQLALAEDRVRLFRARSLLFETAHDLDRRNFGVANRHLRSAAAELGAVRKGGAEMDVEGLRALQRDVEGTNLSVATDLEVHRAQVLEFLARLDELMPDERSAPATPARSDPGAIEVPGGGT